MAVPDHLSDEEAATLPCTGVTAWSALVEQGGLRPGESLVVLGTGGVSIFALQFGKLVGARVIVTSSSDAKLERARGLGADETINYTATPDWAKRVRELTGGEGADHVLEVGGGGTFAQSVKATRVGGTVSLIGVLAGNTDRPEPRPHPHAEHPRAGRDRGQPRDLRGHEPRASPSPACARWWTASSPSPRRARPWTAWPASSTSGRSWCGWTDASRAAARRLRGSRS